MARGSGRAARKRPPARRRGSAVRSRGRKGGSACRGAAFGRRNRGSRPSRDAARRSRPIRRRRKCRQLFQGARARPLPHQSASRERTGGGRGPLSSRRGAAPRVSRAASRGGGVDPPVARARPDRRRDGLGQEHDARGHGGRDQLARRAPHPHDRGPRRVRHPAPRKPRRADRDRTRRSRFPTALRAAMRQAPDVLVVGEMRDPETMRIALAAAETGHLVFRPCTRPTRRRPFRGSRIRSRASGRARSARNSPWRWPPS